MPHEVVAKSMIIGATSIDVSEIEGALTAMGMDADAAVDYVNLYYEQSTENDNHANESELLIEFAGRLCYKSFTPGMNANVTKVREGNEEYLKNVIKQGHGSVFEHSSVSVLFVNVTRVFTHEAVRHRPGFAYSQESMRYVRMEDLGYRFPLPFRDPFFIGKLYEAKKKSWGGKEVISKEEFARSIRELLNEAFKNVFTYVEDVVGVLNERLEIDSLDFESKKIVTSGLRRLIPDGVATNILVTGNHRAWRHVFAMRSMIAAEEEIREVMGSLAGKFKTLFPNIYQDMIMNAQGEWIFGSPKI